MCWWLQETRCVMGSRNVHTMTVQHSQIILGIFCTLNFICQEWKLITSILIHYIQINGHPPEILRQSFCSVTEDDVRATMMSSSNASCKLDTIPTWLLKLCIDELAPVITDMVNLSIRDFFPWQLESCTSLTYPTFNKNSIFFLPLPILDLSVICPSFQNVMRNLQYNSHWHTFLRKHH